MYERYNPATGWICQLAEVCGLGPQPCDYDFDLNTLSWLTSAYNGNLGADWCQSKFPYFYTPDPVPYPRRSTGCCLIPQNGQVDYYTDPGNVKIYGYQHYCGDGILDAGEQCDGGATTTCSSYLSCPAGYVAQGTVYCSNCQTNYNGCYCALNNAQ
jgi:hypothetical protein